MGIQSQAAYYVNSPPKVPVGGALGAFAAFMPGLERGVNTLAQDRLRRDALEQERKIQNQKMAGEGIKTLGEILKLPKNMRGPMIDATVEKMGINPTLGEMFKKADDEQSAGLVSMLREAGESDPFATLAALSHDPAMVVKHINDKRKLSREEAEKEAWKKLGAPPESPLSTPSTMPAPPAPQMDPMGEASGPLPGPAVAPPVPGGAIGIATPGLGGPPGPVAGLPGALPGAPPTPGGPPLTRQPGFADQESYLRARLAATEDAITSLNTMVEKAQAAGLPISEDRNRALKLRLDALQSQRDSVFNQIKELPKPERDVTDIEKLTTARAKLVAAHGENSSYVKAIDRQIATMGVKDERERTLEERVAEAETAFRESPTPENKRKFDAATRAWQLRLEDTKTKTPDPTKDFLSADEARSMGLPYGTTKQQAAGLGRVPLTAATRTMQEQAGTTQLILGKLEDLSKKVHTAKGPVGRILSAPGSIAAEKLQTNPDVVLYNSTANGVLANFARVFGERGTLTDQDISRAKANIPVLYPIPDTQEVARLKLKQLRELTDQIAGRPPGSAHLHGTPFTGQTGPGPVKIGTPGTPYNAAGSPSTAAGRSSADLKKSLGIN